jgi:putative serine protease PepD
VTAPAGARRGYGPRILVATALAAGLVGGAVGGVVGARTAPRHATAPGSPASVALGTGAPAPLERTRSVPSIAARVLPSVVTIDVSSGTEEETGSGVIIRPDGYILTNNHVVAPAAGGGRIGVTRYKELKQIRAQIVGRDPKTDLAVIKISAGGPLPAATLGRSGSLVVGAPVIAIGAPLGLSGTVTTGIVSALDRNPTVPAESGADSSVLIGAIQVDAAINPGNSGGPLLDGGGQVVGVNTAIATVPGSGGGAGSSQSGNIGVGFAIPIDYARSVAEEIISTGRATHPYVGVSAATITPADAQAGGTSPGALVREVEPGGPAYTAGLRPGDVIVKVNDTVIASTNDLVAATRLHRIGDQVSVTYEREGRATTVRVILQEQRD